MKPESSTAATPCALIVDDDPVLRLAMTQCIDRLGYDTVLAADGQQGLLTFRRQTVDIVLLDAAMPVMDGFATCRAIRGLPGGMQVPIIMITIYDDEQSVEQAFDAGANEYVTKPIHWAVLRNRIKQVVESARAARALREDRIFFQSLVDSMPDPTVVCDRSGAVRWINAAARTPGRLHESRIDRPFTLKPGVCDPDQPASTPDDIARRLCGLDADGVELDLRLQGENADGTPLFVDVHARPLLDISGGARGVILRFQDITVREIDAKQLRHKVRHYGELAYRDSLTGLANRRLFEQSLQDAIVDGARCAQQHALLFIDLDGFKSINDTLGHQGGDEVLKLLAQRLARAVRRTDTVCRYGGDEFAVLLRDISEPESVADVARHLLKIISEPMPLSRRMLALSASIGVSLYPSHAETDPGLIEHADKAMYGVKDAGKAGVRFFQPASL